jgi:hypothetical protein
VNQTLLAVESDCTVSIHTFEAQNHQEEFSFIIQRETILVAERIENESSGTTAATVKSDKKNFELSLAPSTGKRYQQKRVARTPTEPLLNVHVKEKKGDFEQKVKVASSVTVAEFKVMLETLSNIPAETMRILVNGRFLKDEATLGDSNVRSNAHVYILRKPTLPDERSNVVEEEEKIAHVTIKTPQWTNKTFDQLREAIENLANAPMPDEENSDDESAPTPQPTPQPQQPTPFDQTESLVTIREYEQVLDSLLDQYEKEESNPVYKEMVEISKAIYREQLEAKVVLNVPTFEGDVPYKEQIRRELMKLAKYYVNEEVKLLGGTVPHEEQPEEQPVVEQRPIVENVPSQPVAQYPTYERFVPPSVVVHQNIVETDQIWSFIDKGHICYLTDTLLSEENLHPEVAIKKTVNKTTHINYNHYRYVDWKVGIEVFDDNLGSKPIWWISEHDSDTMVIQCLKDKLQPVKVCTHKLDLTRWVTWTYFLDQNNRDNYFTATGKYGSHFDIYKGATCNRFTKIANINFGTATITFTDTDFARGGEVRCNALLFILALLLKSEEKMHNPLYKIFHK